MPTMSYDDQQFQMIFRDYLGDPSAPKDLGGASTVVVTRWYPKGPITIQSVGVVVTEAFTGTKVGITFYKSGTSSEIATINCSTTIAAGVASKSPTISSIPAGGYIHAVADGTGDSGHVVAFVDYTRTYNTNWAL